MNGARWLGMGKDWLGMVIGGLFCIRGA